MNNKIYENAEQEVFKKLIHCGYPKNSIIMEARINNQYIADIIVIDIKTNIPLMIIEVKVANHSNKNLVINRAYSVLCRFYNNINEPVKTIAAIFSIDKNELEFIDCTEAIKERDAKYLVKKYTLPTYDMLTSGSLEKVIEGIENKQTKRINVLKHLCWELFPIICICLLVLDACDIYVLSTLRLMVIAACFLVLLIPCFKEIKIGEISLKEQIEKEK